MTDDKSQPVIEYWVVRCNHCGQLFSVSTLIMHMGEGVLIGHTDASTGQGCGKHFIVKEGMYFGPYTSSMLVWQ